MEDNCYYLYGTRGDHCWDSCNGFDVYVSRDLENWHGPTCVFEATPDFWGREQFWAPEVHKYHGKYYMFATFYAEGKQRATHILVSDSPSGRFVPVSKTPHTPERWSCLDGTLYISKAGVPYIVFCHEWMQVSDGEIWAQRLSDDLVEMVGEPELLFKASDPQWATGDTFGTDIARYVTDGPFFYRESDQELFIIWSTLWQGRYVEAIAKSSNGEIDGEWIHSDRFLFEQNGGHGMIFCDLDQKLRFIMHSPNTSPCERPVLKNIAVCYGTIQVI